MITPLRERSELLDRAVEWFHSKWGIPAAAYRESMEYCVGRQSGVPQWYMALTERGEIAAGAGVIDNDFHRRPDLAPNVCAVYVEPEHRGQGMARELLDFIRRDCAAMGIARLYLVTGHLGFYERCGWEFLTMVECDGGETDRMYTAATDNV